MEGDLAADLWASQPAAAAAGTELLHFIPHVQGARLDTSSKSRQMTFNCLADLCCASVNVDNLVVSKIYIMYHKMMRYSENTGKHISVCLCHFVSYIKVRQIQYTCLCERLWCPVLVDAVLERVECSFGIVKYCRNDSETSDLAKFVPVYFLQFSLTKVRVRSQCDR